MDTRTIVIGDVHGCLNELKELIEQVALQPTDRVIFLGDLINRGPDTPGVLKYYRSLPNAHALIGNHELRLLKYRRTRDTRHLKDHDWLTLHRMSEGDWLALEQMQPYLFLEDINTVLVHGGFLPYKDWREQPISITTHVQVIDKQGIPHKRSECPEGTAWWELWQGPPYVIFGHTPHKNIKRTKWALGIDTGCVMGNALTACILPEKKIVQVQAKKAYHKKDLPD